MQKVSTVLFDCIRPLHQAGEIRFEWARNQETAAAELHEQIKETGQPLRAVMFENSAGSSPVHIAVSVLGL